jgi:hypothetical protein
LTVGWRRWRARPAADELERPASSPLTEAERTAIDGFIESYVAWLEESEGVQSSYRCWRHCERENSAFAFLAYQAALDREEKAARVYEARTKCLGRMSPHAERCTAHRNDPSDDGTPLGDTPEHSPA